MPSLAATKLFRLRRRLLAQALARRTGAALVLTLGTWLLLAAGARLGAGMLWQRPLLAGALAFFLLWAIARTAARRPSLSTVAALIDRRGETHDRYLTALAFAGGKDPTPLRVAALRECEAYLAADRPERHFPWRLPREWRALPIPLIALALVLWETRTHEHSRQIAEAQAKAEVAPTVQALQALVKKLEPAAERDKTLQRLAAQIAQGAAQLHQQATDPATAQASALRELSALEQMLESMQSASSIPSISPEERKALAEALAKTPETQPAAEKMSAGDSEGAAKALEAAAQKAESAQQATAALQQALDHLAEQQKLSQAMEQLRQQMAQAGGEPSAALQKLAQMMRSGASQEGSLHPSPGSAQQLQRMLAALQNMKSSEAGSGKKADAAQADGKPSEARSDQAPQGKSREAELALLPGASGLPGTEKDPDFSTNPLGQTRQESAAKGADLSLHGLQSPQGQAFSRLLPGAADATRAKRQYKELYDSLAPAAEDAVLQEEIPLGSRLLLRRYFEAIRPKE